MQQIDKMKIYNRNCKSIQLWVEPLGDYVEMTPESTVVLKPNHPEITDMGLEPSSNGNLTVWLEGPNCGFVISDLDGNILLDYS
jgi:hypothetical protein